MSSLFHKLPSMIRNRFRLSRASFAAIQRHGFSSHITALSSSQNTRGSKEGFVFLIVASLATASMMTLRCSLEKEEKEKYKYQPFSFQIEVDFVDKLARKSYLNFRSQSNGDDQRPIGVPTSLRILTVDLPEISHYGIAGGEGCRLAADRVFPNGIAPPKPLTLPVTVPGEGGTTTTTIANSKTPLLVEQKVWVTSLYECMKSASSPPTVQILQASTFGLNPYNMRHTHQIGHYRYDPGKYESSSSSTLSTSSSSSRFSRRKEKEQEASRASQQTKQQAKQEQGVAATEYDELDAPWHQYAWLDELQVRISGQVPFGETLEPAGLWGRYALGHVYKRTVRPQSLFGSIIGRSSSSSGGVESQRKSRRQHSSSGNYKLELETGGDHCCASHKPHAVIANGGALTRVPHALRLLQKTCRDANVPLYVVRDPRTWGGNTQLLQSAPVGEEEEDTKDLGPILRQLRRQVKDRIVQTCLQAGTGFERGRWVGRMETEALWQAKELWRKSKQVFQPPPDWRQLDERQLEIKLRERGLIEERADDLTQKVYSGSLVSLARKCLLSEELKGQETNNMTEVVQAEQNTESG